MKVGFDYWNVISHYPEEMGQLLDSLWDGMIEVHVISAIGRGRIGTIVNDVHNHWDNFPERFVHEVVFEKSYQSPELKLAKCKELGITHFFDDRKDVCELLIKNGIMAFQVPRKDSLTDVAAERK